MGRALESVENRLGGNGGGRDLAAPTARAREAVNLRVLLELRRRLKSVAEKELSTGADRFRTLRGELRRSEAELRLCARILQTHAGQLAQAVSRTEAAQTRATQTCARLASLERENQDLGEQLAQAQTAAGSLQLSMRADDQARHSSLDSFVVATSALVNELALVLRDQSSISARTRDLIEESEMLAARARSLESCYQTVHMAMLDLSAGIAEALRNGGVMAGRVAEAGEFQLAARQIEQRVG